MSEAPARSVDESNPELPWWRSPWLWGFVIGATVLTLIRPRLRHIPEPPPVLGALESVSGIDHDGDPVGNETLGEATLIHFGCLGPDTECQFTARTLRKIGIALDVTERDDIQLVSVLIADDADDKALRRYRELTRSDWASWQTVGGDVSGWVEPVETAWRGEGDAGWTDSVVLVDEQGRIRGFYTGEVREVVSEVYHRTQHVLAESEE